MVANPYPVDRVHVATKEQKNGFMKHILKIFGAHVRGVGAGWWWWWGGAPTPPPYQHCQSYPVDRVHVATKEQKSDS